MKFEKEAVFLIWSKPVYVGTECPYCKEDVEWKYDDFMTSSYPGDMIGEGVMCPNCLEEIKIEDIEWD